MFRHGSAHGIGCGYIACVFNFFANDHDGFEGCFPFFHIRGWAHAQRSLNLLKFYILVLITSTNIVIKS